MLKVNDTGAKILSIGGLATMAAIATAPVLGGAIVTGAGAYLVWGIVAGASIRIINKTK